MFLQQKGETTPKEKGAKNLKEIALLGKWGSSSLGPGENQGDLNRNPSNGETQG